MTMINSNFDRPTAEQINAAKTFAASIMADAAGRRGALDGRIQPLASHMQLCGPAFTVEVRPGDNLMIHAALVLARPGDVLVIDGQADTRCALMGELMCKHAVAAGLAGLVVDGAIRDRSDLREGNFPVFACASNPNGPTKNLAGRIGHPVSAGGVTVNAGDLVCADQDGVLIVPRQDIDIVLEGARKKIQVEHKRREDIANGNLVYDWLEQALKNVGAIADGDSLASLMARFEEKS
ncbi:RraA family protein [Advenella kashmirensis]